MARGPGVGRQRESNSTSIVPKYHHKVIVDLTEKTSKLYENRKRLYRPEVVP